ncbi:MAG: MFS transporter [Candidatus Woesearchaeota archaeon]
MTYERTIRIYYAYRFLSSFFLIGPIITLFLLEFIPFAQLGIVFAAGVMTAFVFEIPSGVWADRIGRTRIVALGSVLAALELFLIAYGQSFGYFLAAGVIGGLGSALISGADTALVYDSLLASGNEKQSRKVYGKSRAIRYVSIVIAALIGAPLYTYAQTLPLYINSAVMLGAAALILTAREPPLVQRMERSWFALISSGFARVRTDLVLRWFVAFSVFSGLAVWLYHDLFKLPYFEGIGYPVAVLGMVIALVSIIRSYFSYNAHAFEERLGSQRTITMLLLAPGLLLVIMGLVPSAYALLVVIVLYCIWSIQEVVTEAKLHEHIPSSERATVYSVHSFANSLMLFFGALILSWIADVTSLFTALLIAGCTSLLIGSLLLRIQPIRA